MENLSIKIVISRFSYEEMTDVQFNSFIDAVYTDVTFEFPFATVTVSEGCSPEITALFDGSLSRKSKYIFDKISEIIQKNRERW